MNFFTSTPVRLLGAAVLALGLSGCLTDDDNGGDKDDTSVTLTTKSFVAGAQDNATYGSSIDLDDFKAYQIADARGMAADIDLIFAYSTALLGGTAAIYSPDSAKGGVNGSAGFDFMQSFSPANHTVIKSLIVDFASISTKAQLDSLWDVGSPVINGRLTIATGNTFLARSDKDRIVLVKVNSVVAGEDGTVQLEGAARF